MAELLVDTDVLIDHLRGTARLAPGSDAIIDSVVTRCELFAGRAAEQDPIRVLLEPFRELSIDREIAELAGRLRRQTAIRTPDALIAATALYHGLTLVTRNRRYFESVAGLRIR